MKARRRFLETVPKRFRKQSILPDTKKAPWRYARVTGAFYYDYERIPNRGDKKLPSLNFLLTSYEKQSSKREESELRDQLHMALKNAPTYYKYYKDLEPHQVRDLGRACAVLDFAARYLGKDAPTRSNDFHRTLAAIIEKEQWRYLGKNPRTLKRKIDPLLDGVKVTTIVKLPRKGNKNKKPYDNPQVKAWLVHLRSKGMNYSNAYIARKVIQMARIMDIKPPSKRWVEGFLSDNKIDFITGARRHGSSTQGWAYASYIPVEGALHAGDCWQMDATRFQTIKHQGPNGPASLNILVVRDVHSGEIIGEHYGYAEDRYRYIHALEMAVMAKGHLPYELVTDKFPGHNSPEWIRLVERLEFLGVKVTVSSKATAKAVVERNFSTLQQVFMPDLDTYYGEGIKSRNRYAHRSPECLLAATKKAKREGFDFDAAMREAVWLVGKYNTTPYSEYSSARAFIELSPNGMYTASKYPNVHKVDDFRRVDIFGTEKSLTIRNNGLIRFKIQHVEYVFQIGPENYDVIENYRKVRVCYDIADPTMVYLFENSDDPNRKFLCVVEEQKRVQYYGPDADHSGHGKLKKKQKEIREKRAASLAEATAGATADEVDVLMTSVIGKDRATRAEEGWITDLLDSTKDKRINASGDTATFTAPAAAPELVLVEDDFDDFDDLDITNIPRNY